MYVSSHVKEQLAWDVDKWFWVISTIMLSKSTKELKELKNKAVLNSKQHCIGCYLVLSNIF